MGQYTPERWRATRQQQEEGGTGDTPTNDLQWDSHVHVSAPVPSSGLLSACGPVMGGGSHRGPRLIRATVGGGLSLLKSKLMRKMCFIFSEIYVFKKQM